MEEEYNHLINKKLNILVFGDSKVGKSFLLNFFCNNYKNSEINSTEGIDIFIKKINYGDENFFAEFIEFSDSNNDINNLNIFLKLILEEPSNFNKNVSIDGIIIIFDYNKKSKINNYKKNLIWLFNKLLKFYSKDEMKQHLLEKKQKKLEQMLNIPLMFLINKSNKNIKTYDNMFNYYVNNLKKDFNNFNGDNIFFIKNDEFENETNQILNNFIYHIYQNLNNSKNFNQNMINKKNINYINLNDSKFLNIFNNKIFF